MPLEELRRSIMNGACPMGPQEAGKLVERVEHIYKTQDRIFKLLEKDIAENAEHRKEVHTDIKGLRADVNAVIAQLAKAPALWLGMRIGVAAAVLFTLGACVILFSVLTGQINWSDGLKLFKLL